MPALRMTAQEWLLLIFLSFLWGGAYFLASVALKEVEPFALVFCRMALAALALGVMMALLGLRFPKDLRVWGGFLILGLIANAIPFSLIYWGQAQIGGSLASIIIATAPLFTAVIAHVFTSDEKLTPHRLAGILAGMAGVIVIFGPAVLAGSGDHIAAQAAILAAALCYGIGGVYSKRFCAMPPVVPACGQLIFAALCILPMVAMFDHPLSRPLPGLASIAAIMAMALFSTALAFIIFFRILARAGATNVALISLLVPVSAILLGGLILGEVLEPRHFGGMALIACGLIIIDGRVLDYFVKRPAPDAAGSVAPHMLNDPRNLQP